MRRSGRWRLGVVLAGVVLVLIGVGVGWSGAHGLVREHRESVPVTGTVVESAVCTRSGTPARVHYVAPDGDHTVADTDCARSGEQVAGHYDPAHPADADFRAHPTAVDTVDLVIGVLVALFGAAVATAPWWGLALVRRRIGLTPLR